MSDHKWHERWLDCGYLVRMKLTSDHWADFEVYEIVCWEGSTREPRLNKKDSVYSPNPVEKPEDAELLADGFVKWDGCLEIRIKDTMHFCGKPDGAKFGLMLQTIWDIGSTLVPRWDEVCAGTSASEDHGHDVDHVAPSGGNIQGGGEKST